MAEENGGTSKLNVTIETLLCLECLAILPQGSKTCPKCGKPIILPLEESPTAIEVGETFTYEGDRNFTGRIQLPATGFPESRYTQLNYRCTAERQDKCEDCQLNVDSIVIEYNNKDKYFDPSAFAIYFDTNKPSTALNILVERKRVSINCSAFGKKIIFNGDNERAMTKSIVLDQTGREGRAWFIHSEKCDLKYPPNWINAKGWLCKGQKGKIGVLVDSFVLDAAISAPKDEDVEKARNILKSHISTTMDLKESNAWKAADIMRRQAQLKGTELTKGYLSNTVTAGSPLWVKTIEGSRILGITSGELGTTTTGKSLAARNFIEKHLKAGKYHTGRNTEAGLTAGADKIEGIGWTIRKGLLPSNDLGFIIIDNMLPWMLDKQIESRRDGIVRLTTLRNAELWGRCRLKLLSNPITPIEERMQKCTALKMYDRKMIARFAFVVFTYGISSEERYDDTVQEISEEEEEFVWAIDIMLRWNLSQQITASPPLHLWKKIMSLSKELEEKFGCEEIPLLLRSIPYKLVVVAYPFKLLEGKTELEERHIILAYEWLKTCAEDIELDEYTRIWKREHTLTDEEYGELKKIWEDEIEKHIKTQGGEKEETSIYKMIEYIAKHNRALRDEVCAYIGKEKATVSTYATFLKSTMRVIQSSKGGYSFTGRGVRFFKRWLSAEGKDMPLVSETLEALLKHFGEDKFQPEDYIREVIARGHPEEEAPKIWEIAKKQFRLVERLGGGYKFR